MPDSTPNPPTDDGQLRGRIAQRVTTYALIAVGVLASVIILGAAVNCGLDLAHAANAEERKDATAVFISTAQNVMGSLLPVVAAWVGTVLAFYFGKENYEAAARNASALVGQLTTKQKLEQKCVSDAMIKRDDMTVFLMIKGQKYSDIKLTKLISEGFEKDKHQPRNRLPILDEQGLPQVVVHRSTMDAFLARRRDPSAVPPITVDTLTLDELYNDLDAKIELSESYSTLSSTQTLAEAKDLLDRKPRCLDILITTDGTSNTAVQGWLTNVIVMNQAVL